MKLLILSVLVVIAGLTSSLPTTQLNEITDHCEDLTLPHKNEVFENNAYGFELEEQTSDGSYRIKISGRTVFLDITGFIIQARSADNPEDYQTFGSFYSPSLFIQVNTCLNELDTASHNPKYSNTNTYIYVYWVPPTNWNTTVVFT